MKKIFCAILSALLIVSTFAGCSNTTQFTFCPNVEAGDISIVSFNCAAPWGNLLDGTSSNARVKRFAVYMNAVKPDSIGTQEMNSTWMEKLTDLMSDYESYGVQRGGDSNEKSSEMNSIFWLKDKYECIAKDTFWLSETPDVESKYEGAGCYRICSYVMLKNVETGQTYLHMNTHLDNSSDEARVFGAQVIKDKIQEIKETYSDIEFSVVLTGDFNDIESSNPCQTISEVLTSCSTVAPENKHTTYTDWGNIEDEGEPIDFVFTDASPVGYMILDDTTNGYVSDHYGIYATIKL
jgi:endonuclease/exonuclease/phosphatase family metal-dependent hydrolase